MNPPLDPTFQLPAPVHSQIFHVLPEFQSVRFGDLASHFFL